MLGDRGRHILKGLGLGEVRQHAAAFGILRLFLQGETEDAFDLTPALGQNTVALRREGMAAAVESGRDRFIHIGLRRRAQ